jgi:hypothetical protein
MNAKAHVKDEWNSEVCERRHGAIWSRMWWLGAAIVSCAVAAGGYIYNESSDARMAYAELNVRMAKSELDRANIHDQVIESSRKLSKIEDTVQSTNTTVIRMETLLRDHMQLKDR